MKAIFHLIITNEPGVMEELKSHIPKGKVVYARNPLDQYMRPNYITDRVTKSASRGRMGLVCEGVVFPKELEEYIKEFTYRRSYDIVVHLINDSNRSNKLRELIRIFSDGGVVPKVKTDGVVTTKSGRRVPDNFSIEFDEVRGVDVEAKLAEYLKRDTKLLVPRNHFLEVAVIHDMGKYEVVKFVNLTSSKSAEDILQATFPEARVIRQEPLYGDDDTMSYYALAYEGSPVFIVASNGHVVSTNDTNNVPNSEVCLANGPHGLLAIQFQDNVVIGLGKPPHIEVSYVDVVGGVIVDGV